VKKLNVTVLSDPSEFLIVLKNEWGRGLIPQILNRRVFYQQGPESTKFDLEKNFFFSCPLCCKKFWVTSGIYEVFLKRSGRKIWVKPEPRAEPYIPCYTPRQPKGGERSVARSVAEWVQKIFFGLTHYNGLSSILINLISYIFYFLYKVL
jgi:hypothetical protein